MLSHQNLIHRPRQFYFYQFPPALLHQQWFQAFQLWCQVENVETRHDSSLPGKYNTINTMSAIFAATLAGVDKSTIARSLKDFKNAPHRLEYVATINGIKFINDSKATNVDAVRYALDSLVEDDVQWTSGQHCGRKVVWIAGGVDKGNDYERLNDLVKERVKAIVCLGKGNSKIHTAFNGHIKQIADTKNMEEAVNKAFKIAKKGFVVLLSPACASFDLFENYEDRGEQFKKHVGNLKRK